MNVNIIIIGGGASCLAFVDALLGKKYFCNSNNISITIIEKSSIIGPGNAYSDDLSSNILNTKAGNITARKEYPGDFFNWLIENERLWKNKFPDLEVNKDTYVPRSLFGLYMNSIFSELLIKADNYKVNIEVINDEVVKIENNTNYHVRVKTKKGLIIKGNKIILACGTQQSKQILNNCNSISPYPTKNLFNKINTYNKVAVIGARLSAIDAVIALFENGHKGTVTIYSRSGFFPFVRGTQGRYKNTYLNLEYINKNFDSLNLNQIVDLYQKELNHYKILSEDDCFEQLPYPSMPITNLSEFIKKELELSQYNRAWQAILYDTHS